MDIINFITTLFIIWIIIFPFYILFKIFSETKRVVKENKKEEETQRKINVQKISRFIKSFNPDDVFGDYVIENNNIIIELHQNNDVTKYICKNKILKNNKMQILLFFQKKKLNKTNDNYFLKENYYKTEMFENICNFFNEKTNIEKMKELLDMENLPYEERFIDV